MTADVRLHRSAEELLRLFEQRPVALDRPQAMKRRAGTTLGRELNRLQGLVGDALDDRLEQLWCRGQVTIEEYIDLCRVLAVEGESRRVGIGHER